MWFVIGIILLLLGIFEGGGWPVIALALLLIFIGYKKSESKDPEVMRKKQVETMVQKAQQSNSRFNGMPFVQMVLADLRQQGFPKRKYFEQENVQGSSVTKGYVLEAIEIYKNRIVANGREWWFSTYNMQNMDLPSTNALALWFAEKLYGDPNEWQISGIYGDRPYTPSSNPISEYLSDGPSNDPLIGYSVGAKHKETFSTNRQAWK